MATEIRRRAQVLSEPVPLRGAASHTATRLRDLLPDETFEIVHDVGEAPDTWYAIRTDTRETGYIPANAAIRMVRRDVVAVPEPEYRKEADRKSAGSKDLSWGIWLIILGWGSLLWLGTGFFFLAGGAHFMFFVGLSGAFFLIRGLYRRYGKPVDPIA